MILVVFPNELAEEFSPSLTNPSGKALKDVDMYDFLDYMIGRGQQNQATSELKDALIGLKKLESSQPNPPSPNNPNATPPSTPPTKPTPQSTNNPNATSTLTPSNTLTHLKKQTDLESSIMSKQKPGEDKMAGYAKLTPQQIQETIQKWDLSPQANAKGKQRIIVENISDDELAKLQTEFHFKSKKPIVREIDSHQVIHTLREHGDEANEAMRGQVAVTMNDIANYRNYTQDADLRLIQENGKIVYAKQVNGYFVVIEEAFEAQDKLRFFDMWKGKGKINKEVLLAHSQRPKHEPKPKS